MDEQPLTRAQLLKLAVIFEGGMGVVGCVLGWLLGFPPWEHVHWHGADVLWGLAATAPMLAIFFICYRWPIGPLRGIKKLSDDVIAPLFQSSSLLDLAFVSALAGFGEEFLFRGFLQPWAMYWLGDGWGIVIVSVLFGLVHPFSLTYVALAAVAGFYFAMLFYLTDNLVAPVVSHAVYDFIALAVLSRHQRKT